MADDYMSDSFIAEAEALSKVHNKELKKVQSLKRKRAPPPPPKSVKEQQLERLEEGLTTPIAASNKGFKLLQKMGYKEGDAIGLSHRDAAQTNPLEIVVRSDRSGLGSAQSKRDSERFNPKKLKLEEFNHQKFRNQLSESKAEQKVIKQILTLTEKLIPELDLRKDIVDNDLLSTYRQIEQARQEAEDPSSLIDYPTLLEGFSSERRAAILQALLLYTRSQHNYCYFCSSTFDDQMQLDALCPGIYESDH